jgi:hypothetical protein
MIDYGNAALELMDNEGTVKDVVIEKPKLSGRIEFVKLDGNPMPVTRTKISTRSITVEDDEQAEYSQYRLKETYPGGTAFKIKFTTTAPAYVYIFGEDDKQVISRLFPFNPSISAAINSKNATVFLPSENRHARLSNQPGKENICVLYSKQQINFEDLLSSLKQQKVRIGEAVKNKFGNNLLPIKQVKFSEDNIAFEAPADETKMLCFFVELEHK